VEYRALGSAEWGAGRGASHAFPHSDRTIHRVELTGLAAASVYEFRFNDESRVYRFRTMPAELTRPLRFAAGGDVRHERAMMEKTNRVAMKYDLDFILWGGDLAYANADPRNADRWYDWFDIIKNTLVDEDGRMVPIVVTLGNHEVFWTPHYSGDDAGLPDEWGYKDHDAVFFYDLFAYPRKPGYAMLDFGKYLSLALLNTDHGALIPGQQTEWLRDAFEARRDVRHLIPVYHVPAYPSVREYDGWANPEVRENWSPLFERYGVRFAFENHDHAYKRTHPIVAEKVDPRGVVYMGDGAWGVNLRDHHSVEDTWYLAAVAKKRHAIIVTLEKDGAGIVAVDEDGVEFDSYEAK